MGLEGPLLVDWAMSQLPSLGGGEAGGVGGAEVKGCSQLLSISQVGSLVWKGLVLPSASAMT